MKRFTDDYLEYCTEFCDAPPLFHTYVAYWLISCMLERRVFLRQGDQEIYPNLYVVLLAPSSLYHKSSAISSGIKLLTSVKENFLWPQEYSHESLVSVIQEQPAGTFFYDEISSLLELAKKDYAGGVMALLTTLYSGGNYRRTTGTGSAVKDIRIVAPFVNIMGASTISWLKTNVKGQDIMGGFLPRFLFVPQTERKSIIAFQPPANVNKRNLLISQLHSLNTVEGEAKYTQEAVDGFSRWYENFIRWADGRDEKLIPFLHRLSTYCHKLALILAVERREFPTITLEAHTEAKLRIEHLARLLDDKIIRDLGLNKFQRDLQKAEKIIQNRNSDGVAHWELSRETRISAKDLESIIRTLKDSEIIREDRVAGHGRTKTLYFWNRPHA